MFYARYVLYFCNPMTSDVRYSRNVATLCDVVPIEARFPWLYLWRSGEDTFAKNLTRNDVDMVASEPTFTALANCPLAVDAIS